jgi:hypothetical protein
MIRSFSTKPNPRTSQSIIAGPLSYESIGVAMPAASRPAASPVKRGHDAYAVAARLGAADTR